MGLVKRCRADSVENTGDTRQRIQVDGKKVIGRLVYGVSGV